MHIVGEKHFYSIRQGKLFLILHMHVEILIFILENRIDSKFHFYKSFYKIKPL